MQPKLGLDWKNRLYDVIRIKPFATELRESSLQGRLRSWTTSLTTAVAETNKKSGWISAAKGHPLDRMPEGRKEFLTIDVMAFQETDRPWLFPVAAIELENSRRDDRIAYSLWKVLNLNVPLRLVFCYRPSAERGAELVRHLARDVVNSMAIEDRSRLGGETLVAVGYRNRAETFPYGFFKWWRLNPGLGKFEQF